jgi:YbbR domain-containing protein
MNKRTNPITLIKDFFAYDTMWKILSLIIAIFLWFVVMNLINPTETKTFSAYIQLENTDSLIKNGYVITNGEDFDEAKINIKVEATRPALDELSKPRYRNNISATVDLAKLELSADDTYPKTVQLQVQPNLPSNLYIYAYHLASYYPSYVELKIDRLSSETKTIEIDTSGSPASGYSVGTVSSSDSEVVISGPSSEMAKVASVKATLDIADATDTVERSVSVLVYDNKGNRLKSFNCEPSSVTMSVPITKQGVVAVNEPRTTGELPDNLNLSSIEWSPKSIKVLGRAEQVNKLKSIELPTIDLSSLRQSTTMTFDISEYIEQAGLSLRDNGTSVVTVNINIGSDASETLTLSKSDLQITGIANDLYVKIPDEITISMVGANKQLTAAELQPKLDLTGLGEGTHKVELNLTLPSGVTLTSQTLVNVELIKKSTEQTTQSTVADTTSAEVTTVSVDDTASE